MRREEGRRDGKRERREDGEGGREREMGDREVEGRGGRNIQSATEQIV